MIATAIKSIHERFDNIEKTVVSISERQEATEKSITERAAKISGKSKVFKYA